MVVNSATKVVNLNADMLDGLDSSALQRRVAACGAGTAIRSVAVNGSVSCQDTRTTNILTNGGSAQALPFSFNVSTHGGPLLIFLSGSGWRTPAQGGGYIQMDVVVDGYTSDTARVFSNETSSHKALVAGLNLVTPPAGVHQFTVQLVQGTADGSDEFHVSVLELPH